MDFSILTEQLESILNQEKQPIAERLEQLCEYLKKEVPHYNWVGFYFRHGQKEELKLGPYSGAPTDHTVIPFGKGICGQVAVSNETFTVADVKAQDNYIACSIDVKAEIVVPLFLNGENIGQIDIDSNTPNPFTAEDEIFLKALNEKIAPFLTSDFLANFGLA